jgi:hypothetical protein
MALQLGALRDALLAANISPEKAAAAAEEVAGYENRLNSMESELRLLKWMVSFNIALTAAVLLKLLV